MKKIFTLLFACFAFYNFSLAAKHPLISTDLLISEVYGGGGNTGAPYQNDFVEIYNNGASSVNLGGLSIQYGSAAGFPSAGNSIALSSFILPAGKYYLIKLGSGGAVGAILPSPDQNATTNISATAGKVYLVNGTVPLLSCTDPLIIDFVGYGTTASCSEGANAPAGSNTNSLNRTFPGVDTDNNSVDFTTASPTPRSSAFVLPISTVQIFTANKTSSTSSLNWFINCNTNAVTIDVERSANGRNFDRIFSQTATQERCSAAFTFTDAQPLKGVNYYRLKVTNIDGEVSYSGVASTRFGGSEPIKAVPTIASNDVQIFYEAAAAGISTWIVYDANGRAVRKTDASLTKGQNAVRINLSNLNKGQYQISGITASGKTETVQIIKDNVVKNGW